MCVLLLLRLGLVIQDVQVPVANLEKVDMTRDDFCIDVECETTAAIVCDVFAGEINGYFHCGGYGVINEHEALQCLMPLLVCRRGRENQRRNSRCMVFFSGDRRGKL